MSQDHFTIRGPAMLSSAGSYDMTALTQIAALCNRAEFKPGQVNL